MKLTGSGIESEQLAQEIAALTSLSVRESAGIRFTCGDTAGATIAIEVSRPRALLYRPGGR